MLNFVILLIAMCASGAIGFFLARERYMTSGEAEQGASKTASRMRRRARDAEEASKRLKVKRDQLQRPRHIP